MVIKQFLIKSVQSLKPLIPPLLWGALRGVFSGAHRGNRVFEGVYENLEQVAATGYDNDASLNEIYNETTRKLSRYLDKYETPETSPLSPISNLLPLLVTVAGNEKTRLSVLDYGGGMGTSYIDCLQSLQESDIKLDYHIVDLKSTIEYGRKLFKDDSHIEFYDDIPLNIGSVDVIYLGSVLQYINEYKTLIYNLLQLSPAYVFITDNFMGCERTYATTQVNMKDRKMAYWIFQLQEIKDIFKQNGYRNIYQSFNYQPYHHFDNFPENNRVSDSCNLLFCRN